ncbi:MAG: PatB family C-S lyase [Clostridia bacterium]
MKYNFDEIIDRRGDYTMKYGMIDEVYPNAPKDSIPLWIADMDFACPDTVIEDICDFAKRTRIFGYSKLVEDEYYDVVKAYMKRHFEWDIERENILFSNGIVPALNELVRNLSKVGDNVIIQTPAYHPFELAISGNNRNLFKNRMIYKDGNYTINFEEFEKMCEDPKTSLFILCSPQNPSGRVWTESELRKLTEIALKNNVKIVSDEIHFDIVRNGVKHIPLDKLFPHNKNIVTCTAPSKTFNIAGLHISNIIINDEKLAKKWYYEKPCGHPSPLSIAAILSCYKKCDDWRQEMLDYIDENFKVLDKFIKENMPKAKFSIPQATYLAWVDLSKYGYSKQEIMNRTIAKGVLIEGEDEFVDNAEGFIRINLALPKATLIEALTRLKFALE